MTNPDVLAKRLLQRAHNRDGLPEILTGILFLLISADLYAVAVLPHRSVGSIAAILTFSLGLPVTGFLTPRWIRWVRRRYLVAREGYVEPRPCRRPLRLWQIAAFGGAVTAFLALAPIPGSLMLAVTGVGGGLLLALCGGAPRFYFSGLVMATTGLIVAFARMPMDTGFPVIFGVQGALELILGTVTWIRFLRETNEP